jgi:hypothetical protein
MLNYQIRPHLLFYFDIPLLVGVKALENERNPAIPRRVSDNL